MFRISSFLASTKTAALNEDALRKGMRFGQQCAPNKKSLQTKTRF
jgi:hypothetical protein